MERPHPLANPTADGARGAARRYLRLLDRYPMLPLERPPGRGLAGLVRVLFGFLRLWRMKA